MKIMDLPSKCITHFCIGNSEATDCQWPSKGSHHKRSNTPPALISSRSQLRVLSKLNIHELELNVRDAIILMCSKNNGIKIRNNFCCFVHPLQYHVEMFFAEVVALLQPFGHTTLQNSVLIQTLLDNDSKFPNEINKNILLQFIHKSGRFDWKISESSKSDNQQAPCK